MRWECGPLSSADLGWDARVLWAGKGVLPAPAAGWAVNTTAAAISWLRLALGGEYDCGGGVCCRSAGADTSFERLTGLRGSTIATERAVQIRATRFHPHRPQAAVLRSAG